MSPGKTNKRFRKKVESRNYIRSGSMNRMAFYLCAIALSKEPELCLILSLVKSKEKDGKRVPLNAEVQCEYVEPDGFIPTSTKQHFTDTEIDRGKALVALTKALADNIPETNLNKPKPQPPKPRKRNIPDEAPIDAIMVGGEWLAFDDAIKALGGEDIRTVFDVYLECVDATERRRVGEIIHLKLIES